MSSQSAQMDMIHDPPSRTHHCVTSLNPTALMDIPLEQVNHIDKQTEILAQMSMDYSSRIAQIQQFAADWQYDDKHCRHVAHLCLQLFDQTRSLHQLSLRDRLFLEAAALLHDIGKAYKPKIHHKIAQDLIVAADELPFSYDQRIIIGLIARYHRAGFPSTSHKFYQQLSNSQREQVNKIAALLRLADGLDKGHFALVRNLKTQLLPNTLLIHIQITRPSSLPRALNKVKFDLFRKVFQRSVTVDTNFEPFDKSQNIMLIKPRKRIPRRQFFAHEHTPTPSLLNQDDYREHVPLTPYRKLERAQIADTRTPPASQ